jgi:multiple sugar transport system ATP-binding protein
MGKVYLDRLTKLFGSVPAVSDVTLEIKDRAFVTLLGPSGCGKSTTLNLIAGLEEPTSGDIYLNDELITDQPPNLRNMAMVFQNYALYPHMNVFENMAFSLRIAKRPLEEQRRRVETVAKMLHLEGLLERRPRELSGGQQQRVALGRAIVREPEVFLLDEPLSNLDARLRIQTRAELKQLHHRLGATTVFVTHDQEEAMVMSDYIAVMQNGRILQYGTPAEIYGQPTHLEVANFIGNPPMNFLDGLLSMADGRSIFSIDGAVIPLDADGRVQERTGSRPLILGIRPEDITIDDQSAHHNAPATVTLLQPVGADTYVSVSVGDSTLTARSRPNRVFGIGDRVFVNLNSQKLHFFDKTSGTVVKAR